MSRDVLLSELFHCIVFNERGEGLWEPETTDIDLFGQDDSGLCHTLMDTIFEFEREGRKNALAVFVTYEYDGEEINSCHACAPVTSLATFEWQGGHWQLKRFRKNAASYGAWGEPCMYSLRKVSNEGIHVLVFEQSYTATGNMIDVEIWHELNQFEEVFRIEVFDEYPIGCLEHCDEDWCEGFRSIRREIVTQDLGGGKWYNFLVRSKETSCNNPDAESSVLYIYDGKTYVNRKN